VIPNKRAHIYVAAGTDDGLKGKNNEDMFSVTAYQLSETDDTPVLFSILADGIGGHESGEVASSIAVEMISQAVAESDASQPTAIMQAAMIQASKAIRAQAEEGRHKKGMGTTCVCAWIIDLDLYIASAGNSRAYILRGKKLIQINKDHTWVQEAVDAGALTPEQARTHPSANVIQRHLGNRQGVDVDLRLFLTEDRSDDKPIENQGTQLQSGDRLLLCSDGLTDLVEDKDIFKVIYNFSIQESVQKLIDKANEVGGKDNITIIIIEIPGGKKRLTNPFIE
jgi:serine/threonine protein phosphatase PrpC